MANLTGRIALVTGAGVNIGRNTARTLAEAGASVACLDINKADVDASAAAITAGGGKAIALTGDVRVPADINAALDAAEKAFGGVVDIIVNNAAVMILRDLRETTLEEWKRVVDITMTGAFVVTQAAVERMIARGARGAIVNMCSGGGHRAMPQAIAYATAKGGILNFTRTAAIDLAKHQIRVNCISPSRAAQPTRSGVPGETPRVQNPDPGNIPLGRIASAQDIGNAIAFLVSDEAAFITGIDVPVDGGSLAM
jgi:NAD(P)-dependent dehydrogenase (short-subunit alcohol dehydrogenase family)